MRLFAYTLALVAGFAGACTSSDVSRELGARCDLSSECDERCLEPSMEWPGGFCTISCDTDADCPEGSACVDEAGTGVCAFRCPGDTSCGFLGEGYTCNERDGHATGSSKVNVCRG